MGVHTVDTLLADAHMRATSLLNEHAGLLETVAQSLLEYRRLDRDELRALYVASLQDVRSPIETDTLRQETGVFKESALVSSAARRHQERRAVVVKRSKTDLARRLVRRLSFRRRRLRAL